MVTLTIYVEGGGKSKSLNTRCKEGFSEFLSKSGLSGAMPRVFASGSRESAYSDFCTAVANGQAAMLLVDSEAPVAAGHRQGRAMAGWMPWAHLANHDRWNKPARSDDADCHLMVQCMESWILADRRTLEAFFGKGFQSNALPTQSRSVEDIRPAKCFTALKSATLQCKARYAKGELSFKLLARIDPDEVTKSLPWAKRFVDEVKKQMGR